MTFNYAYKNSLSVLIKYRRRDYLQLKASQITCEKKVNNTENNKCLYILLWVSSQTLRQTLLIFH